jgi:hypothetical protein
MIDHVTPMRRALRKYYPLVQVVGFDDHNEAKIYNDPAPEARAPYVTVHFLPNNRIINVFGDDQAVQPLTVVLKAWGRTERDAWALAEQVEEALYHTDYEYDPYEVIRIIRAETPEQLPDRDTNLTQVVMTYDMILAR